MTQPQKNTVLALAIVVGLASLPLEWMTFPAAQAQVDGPFARLFSQMFANVTITMTGMNGSVSTLVETPIWVIVAVAVTASVLQLMRSTGAFAIPRVVEWLVAIVAVAWMSYVVVLPLFSDHMSLGIGTLLGFCSALIPLACLLISNSARHVAVQSPPQ